MTFSRSLVARAMPFSLYIHIPYCQAKCPYCDFNSHAASSWPEADYVAALIAEMGARARQAPFSGAPVKTIFFGGGTPSLFAPQSIGALIEAAHRTFGIERDAEITLEANPGTVDRAKLSGFRAAGVNRISFGAQSFKPETLKFLGRIHSAEETRRAARETHQAGFERFNLDLIFAVPGQSLTDVRADIAAAAALEPDHISAYNLTFEEGTVFFAELKRGRIRALDDDLQAAMYELVRAELPARGYPMYEISNYAPLGHEAQHNLSYWRAESYLGLGAGAHSHGWLGDRGRRWWNEKAPQRYIERARIGDAEAGGEDVALARAMGEFVFLHLRLRAGFTHQEFAARFNQDFEAHYSAIGQRLQRDGLLVAEQGRVFLSDRGLEVADSVFAEFV